MADPVGSLDLLGVLGRGNYVTAQQFAVLAGPEGERHVKILARDVSTLAGQAATVGEFASNVTAELTFTLAEAEARIAVLMGMIPEDNLEAAKAADMKVGVEWENRRRYFSMKVPIGLKKKERIGLILAECMQAPAPTQESFDALLKEAEAVGLKVEKAKPQSEGQDAVAQATAEVDAPSKKPNLQVVDGGKADPAEPVSIHPKPES
jgi:hypothetical protein